MFKGIRHICWIISACISIPCVVCGAEGKVSVATFCADVTPPAGDPPPYGMGKNFNRVTDPLFAKGLILLPEDQKPMVLCSLDWCTLGEESYDAFREALARAVGTTPQRVSVHTVHQHGAPSGCVGTEKLAAEHGAGGLHVNIPFTIAAIDKTAEAARKALTTSVPATHVGVGKGRVEQVASNRRIIGDDGKMKHWRGSGPARDPLMFELPEGLIDPDVRLVALWNGDKPVAALTYYATHPMSMYGDGEISADFVGIARNLRDAAVPGIMHIYFNGGAGNIAPGKYNLKGLGSREILARRLAAGMEAAWEQARNARVPLVAKDVAWRFIPVQLPLKPSMNEVALLKQLANPKFDKLEKVFCAEDLLYVRRNGGTGLNELSRLTIGPAEIVHYPGEPLVEYQLAAQKMRPDRFVCFAGYAEYGPAYISTEVGHFQGGFEAERWCRTAAGAERVLLTATRQLLDAPPRPDISATLPAGASPYVRLVIADRPVAYFRLGETNSAGGLHDSSNAHLDPGMYYGNPKAGEPGALAGDPDTAMRFDGKQSWALASTTVATVPIKASFSVEVWAKSATPAFNTMAWFVSRRGQDGFIFGPDVHKDGEKIIQGVSAWVMDDKGRTDASVRFRRLPDNFDVASWHHYGFTYDADADIGTIYIDGEAVITKSRVLAETNGKRSPAAMINLVIGRDDAQPGRFGDGWLDEVAVYDKALSAGQMASHFKTGR